MDSRKIDNNRRQLTVTEEVVNGITHGIGALLSIAGLVILIITAVMHGNAWHIVVLAPDKLDRFFKKV